MSYARMENWNSKLVSDIILFLNLDSIRVQLCSFSETSVEADKLEAEPLKTSQVHLNIFIYRPESEIKEM